MYKLQEWVLGCVLFGSHHVRHERHDKQSRQEKASVIVHTAKASGEDPH